MSFNPSISRSPFHDLVTASSLCSAFHEHVTTTKTPSLYFFEAAFMSSRVARWLNVLMSSFEIEMSAWNICQWIRLGTDGARERGASDMRVETEAFRRRIALSFSSASPPLLVSNPTHVAPSDGMNSRSCLPGVYTKTDCPSQGFV